MGRLKMQFWNLVDQIVRLQNAGPENAGLENAYKLYCVVVAARPYTKGGKKNT